MVAWDLSLHSLASGEKEGLLGESRPPPHVRAVKPLPVKVQLGEGLARDLLLAKGSPALQLPGPHLCQQQQPEPS